MKVPHEYRLKNSPRPPDGQVGGMFDIPHPKILNYSIYCIATSGGGWDHVSVSIKSTVRKVERCPTWEEMCFVKSLFWDDEESAMQLHPPKSQWVNNHPYCLHLWRPQDAAIPLPNPLMVGHPALDVQTNNTQRQ